LPEQLLTRATWTLHSEVGHRSTNSKTSSTASRLCHSLHLPITTTERLVTCTTEFLDSGATCNTPLVYKRTFSIVLNTNTSHYIHKTFRKLLFHLQMNTYSSR
jgi:hypothetical protein